MKHAGEEVMCRGICLSPEKGRHDSRNDVTTGGSPPFAARRPGSLVGTGSLGTVDQLRKLQVAHNALRTEHQTLKVQFDQLNRQLIDQQAAHVQTTSLLEEEKADLRRLLIYVETELMGVHSQRQAAEAAQFAGVVRCEQLEAQVEALQHAWADSREQLARMCAQQQLRFGTQLDGEHLDGMRIDWIGILWVWAVGSVLCCCVVLCCVMVLCCVVQCSAVQCDAMLTSRMPLQAHAVARPRMQISRGLVRPTHLTQMLQLSWGAARFRHSIGGTERRCVPYRLRASRAI